MMSLGHLGGIAMSSSVDVSRTDGMGARGQTPVPWLAGDYRGWGWSSQSREPMLPWGKGERVFGPTGVVGGGGTWRTTSVSSGLALPLASRFRAHQALTLV